MRTPELERVGHVNLTTPPFASWCIWHGLAVAAIVLIPIRLEFDVIWNLDPDSRILVTGVAVAYVTSVTLLTLISRYRGEARVRMWCGRSVRPSRV